MRTIKKYWQKMRVTSGYKTGKFMLHSCFIATVIVLVLMLIAGISTLRFRDVFEFILAIPIFALITCAVRIVLKLVHLIIRYKAPAIDIILACVIVAGIGFLLSELSLPESNFLWMILAIAFDVAYVALMIWLLLPDRAVQEPDIAQESEQKDV